MDGIVPEINQAVGYALLTQVVKTWFIRRFGE
jgi:hypothetical protein